MYLESINEPTEKSTTGKTSIGKDRKLNMLGKGGQIWQ